MVVIGYSGSARNDKKDKAGLLKKLKEHTNYFDSFMSFGEDEEDIPINYFPLKGLGHDCSVSLLDNGEIVASVSEERFNRKKHSLTIDEKVLMPKQSLKYCLEKARKQKGDIDYICYYLDMSEEVFEKKNRILSALLPEKVCARVIRANVLGYEREFCRKKAYEQLVSFSEFEWDRSRVKYIPHHLSHAASAFYSSGFEEGGILTLDGCGEKDSSVFALGKKNNINLLEETSIPTSLGILYMVITVFLGFKPLNDEYKVMGLASYGNPKTYEKAFDNLITINDDGNYETKVLLREDLREYLKEIFGPPREYHGAITRREMNIAASLQKRLEECVLYKLECLKNSYAFENLCLSGGVALNCQLNGKIAKSKLFKSIFVFPASGDDGCSLGAAQYFYHHFLEKRQEYKRLKTVYLGPEYTEGEIKTTLAKYERWITFEKTANIEDKTAQMLAEQRIVGWFQGRMEFGPRALGNRSILGDPRNPEMKDIINIKVKRRETFRPFAPAVIYERARNYFNMDDLDESSFMLFTVPVRAEIQKIIPSVTHCDGTARIQTVKREDNERFWRLLSSFGGLTGVPVLLNTSFNVKEEPVVCTPDDAVKCFLNTQIDILVISDYMIKKLPDEEERHGETSDKGRHPGYLKLKGSDVIAD